MAAEPDAAEWTPKYSPWLIAIAVMLAAFMEVMDTSIAAVAIPNIAGSISATSDEATWVLTSYLVANAVFIPASTWLSLKFGRKRYLMMSVLIFTIASFACGAANSLAFILFARAIQGAAGGALQPLSQAILMESFPPAKRGLALGMYAMGVVVAPIIGPTLGGFLTDTVSWRWAFYINIPIGIVALLMQAKFLEDPPFIKNAKPGKLDGVGLALLAVWLGALQVVCDKGQEDDWFGSKLICTMATFFVVGLVVWLIREKTAEEPLADLRVFANRNFAFGSVLIALFGACIYGITTIFPLFYQNVLGYDATHSGLVVAPRGIGAVIAAICVALLVSKMDPRILISIGFCVFGGCAYWFSLFNIGIGFWSLFWPILISGLGLAMIFSPLAGITLGTLPEEQLGNGSALFNLLRNVGGSIGISFVNTIAERHLQTHTNELSRSLVGTRHVVQNEVSALTSAMARHAGPHLAMQRAYSQLATTLANQAQTMAFADDFRYLAVMSIGCAAAVFILKKTKPVVGAG